ncbi:MAG TPA: hypothetical protein VL501_05590 [Pyrinomonadaceae bacterium]|nr:hypothetical protein [Pyrinomonadaceae bacterium]
MARSRKKDFYDPEPRWPAIAAVLAVAGLYFALPEELIVGPRWVFPVLVVLLLIPTAITHARAMHAMNRYLGFSVQGLLTVAMIASVVLLIRELIVRSDKHGPWLLVSAGCLWATNVLVFTLWYWRLDAGGPHSRDKRLEHTDGSFLFPQMTMPADVKEAAGETNWSPNFFDYLFLAFNTSTAFSPTDVPVLARWAKILMMVQSIISLTVLALLAARAVNIL